MLRQFYYKILMLGLSLLLLLLCPAPKPDQRILLLIAVNISFPFYQSTPWQDAKELPAEVDRRWERREVIAPVTDTAPPPASAAAVTRRNNLPTSSASRSPDRRKSAPAQPRWNSQG